MDISDTIAPNSEQLDAVDLLSGPRTFTIESVSKGSAEQPVQIHLSGFPRPWRPGKSMRRVLIAVWGADAAVYVGRRLTLFCDNTVRFGGAEVGGVRIAKMSHLEKRRAIPLLVSKGRNAMYVVDPLPDTPQSRGGEVAPEVSPPPPDEPAPTSSPRPALNPRLRGKMFALFNQVLDVDEKTPEGRQVRLDYINAAIGHPVESSNELTPAEAGVVVQMLEADVERSAS